MYIASMFPYISHLLAFCYTPWFPCLQLCDIVHVRVDKAVIQFAHESEVMDERQVGPNMRIAKGAGDLFKCFKCNTFMKKVVHGSWITAQDIRSPAVKSKVCDRTENK